MAVEPALESLEVSLFGDMYRGRRVLLTGHTGFKGSWLALWLAELGAEVTGLALSPRTNPNHWSLLGLELADHRLDVRNFESVCRLVESARPELVLHLAAQPLVRHSYKDPVDTWSTNVMGTVNILDACRRTESVCGVVIVSTDKCYQNRGDEWSYSEVDPLGGHDPYSASKAATELVAASYRDAYFSGSHALLVATGRAGNVIGGGDWSEDRLIPDVVRAATANTGLEVRFPNSTRPWQHVLESLSGYLLIGQMLLEGKREFACAWNLGPPADEDCTVQNLLVRMREHWPRISWTIVDQPQPHEAQYLRLDSTKAQTGLGWRSVWPIDRGLRVTADWYRAFFETGSAVSKTQLEMYVADARAAGLAWSCG